MHILNCFPVTYGTARCSIYCMTYFENHTMTSNTASWHAEIYQEQTFPSICMLLSIISYCYLTCTIIILCISSTIYKKNKPYYYHNYKRDNMSYIHVIFPSKQNKHCSYKQTRCVLFLHFYYFINKIEKRAFWKQTWENMYSIRLFIVAREKVEICMWSMDVYYK